MIWDWFGIDLGSSETKSLEKTFVKKSCLPKNGWSRSARLWFLITRKYHKSHTGPWFQSAQHLPEASGFNETLNRRRYQRISRAELTVVISGNTYFILRYIINRMYHPAQPALCCNAMQRIILWFTGNFVCTASRDFNVGVENFKINRTILYSTSVLFLAGFDGINTYKKFKLHEQSVLA